VRLDTAESLRTWRVSSVGLGAGVIETMGRLNLIGFQWIRGSVYQNQAGVLVINMYVMPNDTVPASSWTVPVDAAQPNFTYAWDVIVMHPYVEIAFTNGGVASTVLRAQNTALPN